MILSYFVAAYQQDTLTINAKKWLLQWGIKPKTLLYIEDIPLHYIGMKMDGNRRKNPSTISVSVFYYEKRELEWNSRERERKRDIRVTELLFMRPSMGYIPLRASNPHCFPSIAPRLISTAGSPNLASCCSFFLWNRRSISLTDYILKKSKEPHRIFMSANVMVSLYFLVNLALWLWWTWQGSILTVAPSEDHHSSLRVCNHFTSLLVFLWILLLLHKYQLLAPLLRRCSPCWRDIKIKCRSSPLPAFPPLGLSPLEGRWMAVCGVWMCLIW